MDNDEVRITGSASPAQLQALREFLEVFLRDTDRHGHMSPYVEEIRFSIT